MKIGKIPLPLDDIKMSTMVSVFIHGVVLVIFLFLQISTKLDLPEFVEVSFTRGGVQRISPPKLPEVVRPSRPPISTSQPEPTQKEALLNENIRLPKRRMLEEEPPELRVPRGEKKTPEGRLPVRIPEQSTRRKVKMPFIPRQEKAGKETVEPGRPGQMEKMIPDVKLAAKAGLDQSFEIKGKAAARKILNKVLPSYPTGYGKEGTIRIRFTILPNGMVGEMIPVLKTDAVLEENAMSALKKWRFNPIPQNAPQEIVEGIITFRYKLK